MSQLSSDHSCRFSYLILSISITFVLGSAANTLMAMGQEVRIASTPSKAIVFVNQKRSKRPTPCLVSVNTGDTVQIKSPGYQVFESRITSNTEKVTAELEELTNLRMLVEAKTGDRKRAGTEDLSVVLQLNASLDYQRPLNHRGRDRRVGVRDKYTFGFDCPQEKLKGFRVAVMAGDDAWNCDYFAVRFVKDDGSMSQLFTYPVHGWFSADAKEGKRIYDTKFGRVKFAFEKADESNSITEAKIAALLSSRIWRHGERTHYRFAANHRVRIDESRREGTYRIEGATGRVSFHWDSNDPKTAGQSIQLDKKSNTFEISTGGVLTSVDHRK